MFDLIKKIAGGNNDALQPNEQDAMSAHLALTVLLLEAAYADGECSEKEKAHLAQTLVTHFNISEKEIVQLIHDSDKKHKEYVDLFQYTRYIKQHFSRKQKTDIMESVWRIILLDDHLEAHEDHFAHKLANLLDLNHSELIDAKLAARKQLS